MKTLLRLWLALLAILSFGAEGYAQVSAPIVLKDIGIDQKLDAQVPLDLAFRDENGRNVQLRQYFGQKPVILTLVYFECPMLCTQVLNGLVRTLRPLTFDVGKEFDIITVSFDPRETPELAAKKKENYVGDYKRPGAAAGWHFLTGSQESIRKLADAVGFRYKWDEQLKQFIHAAGITVLTPTGKVSKYFYGIDYSPKDLRLGLVEASQNRIGTPVDKLMLYCFHYDPATGKYGWAAIATLRIAAALTLLALIGFIAQAIWRETRQRKRLAMEQAH